MPPRFDDRDGWIWLDGALLPWRDARTHVLAHGLHYGGSCFEGIRAYGGRPFALDAHLDRFARSAAILGMPLPWTREALADAVLGTLAANGLGAAYVRPVAWRDAGAMGVASAGTSVQVAVAAWEWPPFLGARGVRLLDNPWRRPDPETAPTEAKGAPSYAIGTLARDRARAAGFDDALLLDGRGFLAEASGANLFLRQGDLLLTPRTVSALAGITRSVVIEMAKAEGLRVLEADLDPAWLDRADEVFLTGAAAEIVPAVEALGRAWQPGPLAERLAARYQALVRAED